MLASSYVTVPEGFLFSQAKRDKLSISEDSSYDKAF